MSTRRAIPLLLALAAMVVVGCGGADDTAGGSGSGSSGGSDRERVSLVAYSTPEVVYDEIIPDFQKTEAAATSASARRSAHRATRAARSRPDSAPTSCRSRSSPT